MKKVLVIGDSPTQPTGFSTVIFNIFKYFNPEEYEIFQLGINYFGDPHDIPWKIFPASAPNFGSGDIWGYNRLKKFSEFPFDAIFILNDAWVINKYLRHFKEFYKGRQAPPIFVYFPVDSYAFDEGWFTDFDMVTQAFVYTEYGKNVVNEVAPKLHLEIIPHGVDRNDFYKLDTSKEELKKILFPNTPDFKDAFIVLNANRNQPRKRVDLTIEGFSLFAKNKPDNVKLYLHMGLRDVGYDINRLVKRHGIDERLIVTNKQHSIQGVPVGKLNLIYNAADVGINTSLGEGWGLVSVEHSVTGAPQIVPGHSACKELYEDCGLIIPVNHWPTNIETLTVSGLVHPEDVADQLERIYSDRDLYEELSKKSRDKFLSEKYSWSNISKRFEEFFKAT